MRYCHKCVLPDTRPNLVIGPDGVCNACHAHETKAQIDWCQREQAFKAVVANAQQRSHGYDCLIPVSGGKDSHWQLLTCLAYGLHPLAVTWKTPARTDIGRKNLENLVRLGVDHLDYQINPEVEKKFMRLSLERYGSTAIPMHMAIFNIPLKLAVRFRIPLIVWGENSAFEYGSASEAHTGLRLDAEWLRHYGVTHGTTAADWIGPTLSRQELTPYFGPTAHELEAHETLAIFLGYYFRWDPQETTLVAQKHGFLSSSTGPRTGLYTSADIDDEFISIHHWLKWYKFGFTRLFDNLSLEIRNGRITRTEAIDTIRRQGDQTPIADIEKFCAFSGLTREAFFEICEKYRNPHIWKRVGTEWQLPDFLIPDWRWA